MYGPPGIAYVYLVYGMYDCLNVVVEPEGTPAAVLIRAAEPLDRSAADAMRHARLGWWRRRRGRGAAGAAGGHTTGESERERARLASLPDARLASGPGLLAAAFDITRPLTGRDLLDAGSPLRIEVGRTHGRVAATARIGIAYAAEPWRSQPWRFVDTDSAAVSGARARGSAS